MVAHRLGTQDQVGGDLSIGLALSEKREYFVFALRQLREELLGARLRTWACAAEVVHQALGDGRAEDGLAAGHGTDSTQRLLLHGALEEVAASPGADGGKDRLV